MANPTEEDAPSVEGSETTTLGSSELHENGSNDDILDGSSLDVESLSFKALLGGA